MNAFHDKPAISVIMPARNEGRRVQQSIASIAEGRSHRFPLQIIVVDDNSSDGCAASLSQLYSWSRDRVRVDVIGLPRWSGIPYARNLGASRAWADILFITDANVIFPQAWDTGIWEHMGPNRALCATIADMDSAFRGYGGTLHLASMNFHWLRSPATYGGYVPLCPCTGTVIGRDLFRHIGGYDTTMPIYGAAEPELSVRLWLSGGEIVSVPNLVLRHRFRPATERRPFLEAIGRVLVQNYLRFGLLYLDQRRAAQLLQYYARSAPEFFEKAIRLVWTDEVWQRRSLLQQRLPVPFDSFVRRFGLVDADGQLGAS